jgi:hypothetical protein
VLQLNDSGKNELSLGFKANLIEHDEYDFEQTELEPHHLAVIERGRCGTACRFIDQKPEIKETPMKKLLALMQSFTDQDGEMTLQQLMEMVSALPDAIRTVPMEQLQKLAPALKEVIEVAEAAGVEIVEPVEEEAADEEASEEDVETADEESGEEEEVSTEDSGDEVESEDEEPSDEEKLAMADGVMLFNDEQVQAAVTDAVKVHSDTVEHARQFVDEAFDFSGKSTIQMKIILMTSKTRKFDHEFCNRVSFRSKQSPRWRKLQ